MALTDMEYTKKDAHTLYVWCAHRPTEDQVDKISNEIKMLVSFRERKDGAWVYDLV